MVCMCICVCVSVHMHIRTDVHTVSMYVCMYTYTDHMKFYCFFHILLVLLCVIVYMVVCLVRLYLILCITYSYCYVHVFLLLCMFFSRYCVSLCCSVYCWCVIVYCTTATGCQPNSSHQIYHIINAYSNDDDISMFRYSGDIVPNS